MIYVFNKSKNKNMEQEQVFEILKEERSYQDSISTKMEHKGCPTVEAELLMMEHYLVQAREKWVTTYGDSISCLDSLRKVAGIAVRCFENHGCPSRR